MTTRFAGLMLAAAVPFALGPRVRPATSDSALSVAGSLSTPRTQATATLLQNGQILVAGGAGIGERPTSADLYDSTTGAFGVAANNLTIGRSWATATLLRDGRVLIA